MAGLEPAATTQYRTKHRDQERRNRRQPERKRIRRDEHPRVDENASRQDEASSPSPPLRLATSYPSPPLRVEGTALRDSPPDWTRGEHPIWLGGAASEVVSLLIGLGVSGGVSRHLGGPPPEEAPL